MPILEDSPGSDAGRGVLRWTFVSAVCSTLVVGISLTTRTHPVTEAMYVFACVMAWRSLYLQHRFYRGAQLRNR